MYHSGMIREQKQRVAQYLHYQKHKLINILKRAAGNPRGFFILNIS
jgi:hypothetical protein